MAREKVETLERLEALPLGTVVLMGQRPAEVRDQGNSGGRYAEAPRKDEP